MLKMNVCLVATTILTTVALAEEKHPVREEIVNDIKLKTTSWKPKEVENNHLRHRSVESIRQSMGHLGTSRPTLGGEIMKTVKHGASEVFNMLN